MRRRKTKIFEENKRTMQSKNASTRLLARLALTALTLTFMTTAAGVAAAQTESVIHTFQASSNLDGSSPVSTLISDGQGALYGTTEYGGKHGYGSVYKLTPNAGAWKETLLYSFTGGADGGNPFKGALLLKNGALYGTTLHGGNSNGYGVIYKLSPGQPWVETVLHTFTGAFTGGTDGFWPSGGLTEGRGGVLYGATIAGGPDDVGTIYSLTPQAGGVWNESVIYSFTNGNDGSYPYYGVTLDSHGALYGTTVGAGSSGSLFKLTPHAGGAWTINTLYFFNGSLGGLPNSPLILDSTGSLYGAVAATAYGSPAGYIFQLSPPTGAGAWTETTLHNFAGGPDDGSSPTGVIFDSTGTLYGTTNAGGSFNNCCGGDGILFKLTPPSSPGGAWTESVLYNFQGGTDGIYPTASLLDLGGTFYGVTSSGGNLNAGTVFSFIP
jgi:uncharacterized repeat protein (TIGR03803 family)